MKHDPQLKAQARLLRQEMTPAELILWKALRGRRFAGYKFRRQQVCGSYILDFFCSHTKLALEIDGETHLGKQENDVKRSEWIEKQGVKVLRFWNNQIYDELESVLEIYLSRMRREESRRDKRRLIC